MPVITVTVSGITNSGKSTISKIIYDALQKEGIRSTLSPEEWDEGFDFIDKRIEAVREYVEILIETKQLNRAGN